MDNSIFDLMESHDYENIIFCQEKTLGLHAIIVIHDTTLGPAAGGIHSHLSRRRCGCRTTYSDDAPGEIAFQREQFITLR